MTRPPYSTPSEALAAGACPYCLGGGRVVDIGQPGHPVVACRWCGGTGRWPDEVVVDV